MLTFFLPQLHLATCTAWQPHVSLMNYTYLHFTPYSPSPTIIMTTNQASRKTHNLVANPNVSLLVHDWVSHRPATLNEPVEDASFPSATDQNASNPQSTQQSTSGAGGSSLAALLLGINSAALGRISATINGTARLVPQGSEEEQWCRDRHRDNHSFKEEEDGGDANAAEPGGGFVDGSDVRVVVVTVREGSIADWKGGVSDWIIGEDDGDNDEGSGRTSMVNGVPES